jgi:capsular polysaccharide transport system ATP-binding protein
MILLSRVTDMPRVFGEKRLLLSDADLFIPQGRYSLLSRTPEYHRTLIDVLTGLRPPRRGFVKHAGLVSWPIGRQGFVRGKASGLRMAEFISSLYGIESGSCIALISDLLTSPEYLSRPMEHWPLYMRQEFTFALALVPAFDIYVIEGAIPFEPCRFTRLWQALFEERLAGRTLILSTYRQNQMTDYCIKGLVYEQNGFRIEDDLDRFIQQFPARQSRSESATDGGGDAAIDSFPGGDLGF